MHAWALQETHIQRCDTEHAAHIATKASRYVIGIHTCWTCLALYAQSIAKVRHCCTERWTHFQIRLPTSMPCSNKSHRQVAYDELLYRRTLPLQSCKLNSDIFQPCQHVQTQLQHLHASLQVSCRSWSNQQPQ